MSTDVWVVEDNTFLRDAFADVLATTDGLVCSLAVGSAEEALAALASAPAPDVVLMDLGLPGMSGLECTRRIREVAPDTLVLVITVHDDEDRVFEALCAGAVGYLLKPSSGEAVLQAIETACAGGSPMNARIARKVIRTFADGPASRPDYGLTEREEEILHLLLEELTQREIARHLFVSPHTVDTHLRHIYAKLSVHSRSGAVAKALQEGLIRRKRGEGR